MTDGRSDHDLLIRIDERVAKIQKDIEEIKTVCISIPHHEERIKDLSGSLRTHKSNHKWYAMLLVSLVAVVTAVVDFLLRR